MACNVAHPDGLNDVSAGADENPAALIRKRVMGVRGDFIDRCARDAYRYKASTARAMPIPPPMQSDATP